MTARPYRSVLYIPGSKERALEKATGLVCDAIIFDLEDAVAVDEKVNARATLAKALKEADYGQRARTTGWIPNGAATTCWPSPPRSARAPRSMRS